MYLRPVDSKEMSNTALLIGFKDCQQTQQAIDFLKICGFDTTPAYTEPKRGAKLPNEVRDWSGDYLFHLKSYCILRKPLLDSVKIASINFHPCPPKYPGAGGINWSLYNNDKSSGITVHHMNEKVDNGTIIKVYRFPIFINDTVGTLRHRLHLKQMEAFYEVVGKVAINGKVYLTQQANEARHEQWGPHVGRMREIDQLEIIDPNISPEELERVIRATQIKQYGPRIILHGRTFQYRK